MMPFYDLRCVSCDKEFNIKASVTERMEQGIPCPQCGGYDLIPVFKAAHFTVKEAAPQCPNSHVCGAGCRHAH